MDRETIVRNYLSAMGKGDLEAVRRCFNTDGVVVSPVYGEVDAITFYERLFGDTVSSQVDLYTIYQSTAVPERMAAHFGYVWQRRDTSFTRADLVDLFEFDPQSDLIRRLVIIFDTAATAAPAKVQI